MRRSPTSLKAFKILWNNTELTELKHVALSKKSEWDWSSKFTQLNAAQEWGCPSPSYFYELPKNDKVEIIAWYIARQKIKAINEYEQSQKIQQEAKRSRQK